MTVSTNQAKTQLLVLAKGTRGDVQPLAVVAQAMKYCHGSVEVTFATHAVHQVWLHEVLEDTVHVVCLASLPARKWHQGTDKPVAEAEGFQSDADLEESVAVCLKTLQLSEVILEQNDDAAPQKLLLVFNLFAMEGFHLAEALGVPCVAVSPCLVPYTPPTSFERRFKKSSSDLYSVLRNALPGQLGWQEIEHWMWPLFAPRWTQWRQDRLSLPPLLSSVALSEAPLPSPVSLLYGLSPQIIPQPGYWPDTVHMCGFWQRAEASQDTVLSKLGPLLGLPDGAPVGRWLKGRPLICIDFGSMGAMGAVADPTHLVMVLIAALKKTNAKGVLLTGGWKQLEAAAWAKLHFEPDLPLRHASSVPHEWLMPHCSAIVHHGGAGTCGAALRAGLPQLICPFHFDQHSWAERLVYMGVALQGKAQQLTQGQVALGRVLSDDPQPPGTEQLTRHLQSLLSGQLLPACQQLQASLSQEDGVATAVGIVSQHLKSASATRCGTSLLLQKAPQPDQGSQHKASEDRPNQAADAESSQALLSMPNGWKVTAASEMEAKFIYKEIMGEQATYLQHGIQIRDGDMIMDIGANVGFFIAWLMEGGPGKGRGVPSKVWACEPLPQNLHILNSNLQDHQLTDKVTVIPAALGHVPGELQFRFYPHMPGNSTCHIQEKWDLQGSFPEHLFSGAQDCVCPVTTVSALIEDLGIATIDLLKVDVEGHELQVLQGVQTHHWPLIKQVAIEVHHVGNRVQQVCSMLEEQGFKVNSELELPPHNYMMYAVRP